MHDPDAFVELAHDPSEVYAEAECFKIDRYETTLAIELAAFDFDPYLPLFSRSKVLGLIQSQLDCGGPVYIGGIR